MLFRVQYLERYARLLQNLRDLLRLLDGNTAHQHRLPALVILPDSTRACAVFLNDAVHRRFKFFNFGAINHVRIFDSNQRHVRGNSNDFQFVDFVELRRFRICRPGHAGKLLVHAKIILERDGRERLIFALDFHAFLRFHCLVQAVGPSPSRHLPACEFIHDHDLVVFDHVVHIFLKKRMRAQRLIDVVNNIHIRGVI